MVKGQGMVLVLLYRSGVALEDLRLKGPFRACSKGSADEWSRQGGPDRACSIGSAGEGAGQSVALQDGW